MTDEGRDSGRWASGTAHTDGMRIAEARVGLGERHGDLNL